MGEQTKTLLICSGSGTAYRSRHFCWPIIQYKKTALLHSGQGGFLTFKRSDSEKQRKTATCKGSGSSQIQFVCQPAERVQMNETAEAMPLLRLLAGALRFSVAFHEM